MNSHKYNTVWPEPRSRNRILPAPEEPTLYMLLVNSPNGVLPTPKGALSDCWWHAYFSFEDTATLFSPRTVAIHIPTSNAQITIFPLTLEITFYSILFTCWVKMVSCCYYNLHFSDRPVRMSTMAHSPYIQMRKPRLRAEHWCCPSQFNTRFISVFSTVPRGSTRNQRSLLHQ